MTILDSANWLVKEFGKNTKVIIDRKYHNEFPPENKMVLSNEKIKSIGWSNKFDLKEGYRRLIRFIREELVNEENK